MLDRLFIITIHYSHCQIIFGNVAQKIHIIKILDTSESRILRFLIVVDMITSETLKTAQNVSIRV